MNSIITDTYAKILNYISKKSRNIKRIIHHHQLGFTPGHKADSVQLTLEKHGSELGRSTCVQSFFNKYSTIL